MCAELLPFTLTLEESTQETGGGKASGLSRLLAGGFPVPTGFVVTAHAYRCVTEGLEFQTLLADSPETTRTQVEQSAIPLELQRDIEERIQTLGLNDCPVAVRSSATAEDQEDASFAGQQETYLGVQGTENIVNSIRRCWGSLWSKHAVEYRERAGYSHDDVALAVVVQSLIDAETAGVMFTSDPADSDSTTLINASWGLGESVVSGQVTPDEYRCTSREVLTRTLGTKEIRIDRVNGKTSTSQVPEPERQVYCVSDSDLLQLALMSERISTYFGQPMDVEWALAGGKLWILQARPITSQIQQQPDTRHSVPQKTVSGKPINRLSRAFHADVVEHYPGPYPLDLTAITRMQDQLQEGMEAVGISSTPMRELLSMEDNGAIRVGFPDVRVNLKCLKLLRPKAPSPHQWPSAEKQFKSEIAALSVIPLASMSDREVLGYLDDALGLADRIAVKRFKDYVGPGQLVGARLSLWIRVARCRDVDSHDLLAELGYVTAEVDRELKVLASLEKDSTSYRKKFQDFMSEYGARTASLYLPFSHRSWREDPASLEQMLTVMGNPHEAYGEKTSLAEMKNSISRRFPRFLRKYFERDLELWRASHIARESSVYLVEETYVLARRAIDELAQRLEKRNILPDWEDIKYLTFEELKIALTDRPEALDLVSRVDFRRESRADAATAWWDGLGTELGEAVKGISGSPGRATGTARVITSPQDFGRLKQGDILVCRYTDPSWTPLFSVAAAVVADTGGRLSHAAIVAREYGIPAVMGTGAGTTRLIDGQQLLVDGSAGTVSVLE